MIELRRRMTSSPIYARLTTEDEIDNVPEPVYRTRLQVSHAKSSDSARICFFFSLSGAVFLTSIWFLLHREALYIKIGSKTEAQKVDLADSVGEAAVLYIGLMVLSVYSWISGARFLHRTDAVRFVNSRSPD
jgi:hypothetical protein